MRLGPLAVATVVLLTCFLKPALPSPENEPQDVTYCQLANDPSAYSGKLIRIRAIYAYMFEVSALRAPTCCAGHDASIWVDFEDPPEGKGEKIIKEFPKGMGFVLAVFVGKIETGNAFGTGQRVRFVVQQILNIEHKENPRHGLPAWVPVCFANALVGQVCKEMAYAHENQIDPKPIELRQVQGTGLAPDGTLIPQLCVGIFTEPEHKLLRCSQSDNKGAFAVDTNGLPDGEYRLVGQVIGLCPANAIIRFRSHSHQKKQVVLHMNVRGIDSCSYAELSKK